MIQRSDNFERFVGVSYRLHVFVPNNPRLQVLVPDPCGLSSQAVEGPLPLPKIVFSSRLGAAPLSITICIPQRQLSIFSHLQIACPS